MEPPSSGAALRELEKSEQECNEQDGGAAKYFHSVILLLVESHARVSLVDSDTCNTEAKFVVLQGR